MKYEVTITAVYNGIVEIEASSAEEARCKVEDQLYGDNLAGLPNYVKLPKGGYFSFGEATADYAEPATDYQPQTELGEVRVDFFDEMLNCWCVDVWRSGDPNEEGEVVAEIYPDEGNMVVYRAEWAKTNPQIQDAISEFKERQ